MQTKLLLAVAYNFLIAKYHLFFPSMAKLSFNQPFARVAKLPVKGSAQVFYKHVLQNSGTPPIPPHWALEHLYVTLWPK